MNETLDLGDLDRFTVGAVGPVGRRVFLLECRSENAVTLTLKVEKQQVAVLAEYLSRLLARTSLVPWRIQSPRTLELDGSTDPQWVVGTLGVSYDEDSEPHRVLVAEELVEEGEDGDVARCAVTRAQANRVRHPEQQDSSRPAGLLAPCADYL